MDAAIKGFLEHGVLGLVIVVLLYAIGKLWSKYDDVQEKRIVESREAIKAIEANTNTLETMTEVLRERGKQPQ